MTSVVRFMRLDQIRLPLLFTYVLSSPCQMSVHGD
jgi:hypothetical protein